jgi:hypothetical protein
MTMTAGKTREVWKKIGEETDSWIIHLFPDFVKAHKNEELIPVTCPYCNVGYLILKNKKPIEHMGAKPQGMRPNIIGTDYIYKCSNDGCAGKFFGSISLWPTLPPSLV